MRGELILLLFAAIWIILTFEDFISFLAERVVKRIKEDELLATPEPST